MAERQMPSWLRVLFNLAALFGVVATLMGWVNHFLGGIIMAIAILYFVWEIAPGITSHIFIHPYLTLAGFILTGGMMGGGMWYLWRSWSIPTLVDSSLRWDEPAPISQGMPLSALQLDAKANVPGEIRYTPNIGAILPVGTQTLEAHFVPSDPSRYKRADATVTLQVLPIQTAEKPTSPNINKQSKPTPPHAASQPPRTIVSPAIPVYTQLREMVSQVESLSAWWQGTTQGMMFGGRSHETPEQQRETQEQITQNLLDMNQRATASWSEIEAKILAIHENAIAVMKAADLCN